MSATEADPREQIIARLAFLLGEISGAKVYRNTLRIPDERLKEGPAVAILDGDETPDDSGYGRGRPARGPVIVTMRPEIYGFIQNDDAAGPGPALSALRRAILATVLNDQTLLALCKDGDIRYEGYTSGLAQGRSMDGEMALGLAFVYVLRPSALQP